MIFIKRATIPAVLNLADKDSEGAKEFESALLHFSQKDRDFNFTCYKKPGVKETLELMFNNKCAYCESLLTPVTYGDIEHFRPKTAYYDEDLKSLSYPGYYWLAMDWSNLLLACDKCNRKYKRNLFPLIDENQRLTGHGCNFVERPLLINPCDESINPLDSIKFREDGTVFWVDKKGEISIKVYGLDNYLLTESRKEVAKKIEDSKVLIENYLEAIAFVASLPRTAKSKKIFENSIQDLNTVYSSLIDSTEARAPYSGMVHLLTKDFFEDKKATIDRILEEFNFIID